MARSKKSRLDARREVEAADALDETSGRKKKKKKKAKTSRKKASSRRSKKSSARKRLLWGVFNGNMKEEARFPYHEREAAEKKLEQLQTRSPKKMFFIQPVKEDITEAEPEKAEAAADSK